MNVNAENFSDFTMQGPGDSNLSTGESAIYDRQIRLWGSNAQLRIKSSKVLFIGLSSASVEIAKNTVLAGASVVLEDTRKIDDSTTNFLIQLEVEDTQSMSYVITRNTFHFHRSHSFRGDRFRSSSPERASVSGVS